jgi:hypothetical protein
MPDHLVALPSALPSLRALRAVARNPQRVLSAAA